MNKINGHEYVDLGLPSGNKWAACNIGASRPEESGQFFAWGEADTKEEFELGTYKFWNPVGKGFNYFDKYNKTEDVLLPEDDAASNLMGKEWHIPSVADFRELDEHCKWTWMERCGVLGYEVKGPNGNTMFLPAAGSQMGRKFLRQNEEGEYWASSLTSVTKVLANLIQLRPGYVIMHYTSREYGLPIRAVMSNGRDKIETIS